MGSMGIFAIQLLFIATFPKGLQCFKSFLKGSKSMQYTTLCIKLYNNFVKLHRTQTKLFMVWSGGGGNNDTNDASSFAWNLNCYFRKVF